MTEKTREERAQVYFDMLSNEGFRPSYDSDGDIDFKYEGGSYVLIVGEEPFYVRLLFPNFWTIESDEERVRALVEANEVSASTKVVKLNIIRDNMWAGVELFQPTPEAFAVVFERCLSVLRTGVSDFVRRMREYDAPPVDPGELN